MKYGFEWSPGLILLGIVLVLLIVPHFALIALVMIVLAGLVAVPAAMLATPYLLVRSIRRRRAERRRTTPSHAGPRSSLAASG